MTTEERRKVLLDIIARVNAEQEPSSCYYGEEDRKLLQEMADKGLVSCEPTQGKLHWMTIYPKKRS